MRKSLAGCRRVVVKVGTSVVTRPDGALALGRLGSLVEQLYELRSEGRQVLLVSSGAVGLGAERLGLERAKTVLEKQACAAAGQGALMALYDALAQRVGLRCAQVLLTAEDFQNRKRYVSLRETLERLLELGALPIINENDVVSRAGLEPERRPVFGDNDRLAALVAGGLEADLLLLLTDVDGLLTAPPGTPGAQRIPLYDAEAQVRFGGASQGGTGGMEAKVEAARVATQAGVSVVITSGRIPGVARRVVAGEDLGTLFPAGGRGDARRRWLEFATAPSGALHVNEGARAALIERKASLLPVGVERIEGEWEAGEVVRVMHSGVELGRGVCALSSGDARRVKGRQGERALVHRNDLALLESR